MQNNNYASFKPLTKSETLNNVHDAEPGDNTPQSQYEEEREGKKKKESPMSKFLSGTINPPSLGDVVEGKVLAVLLALVRQLGQHDVLAVLRVQVRQIHERLAHRLI